MIPIIMIAKAKAANAFDIRELDLRNDQTKTLIKASIGINQYRPPTPGININGH